MFGNGDYYLKFTFYWPYNCYIHYFLFTDNFVSFGLNSADSNIFWEFLCILNNAAVFSYLCRNI